jgi:hypothetical protein
MQWETLPALHEAPALDDGDLACLDEIRAVLARNGKLDRFAVHLAHQHFAVGPDEILVEYPDPESRRLVTAVEPRAGHTRHPDDLPV